MEDFEKTNENLRVLVGKIVEQVFDTKPTEIEEIKGKGKNNLVFKIVVDDNIVILRMSNREGVLDLYEKEKWSAEVAINAGVNTPKIMNTGIVDGYAFSFQEYVDVVQRTEAKNEVEKIWFNLGQSAKLINKIPAPNLRVDYEKVIQDLFVDNFFVKNGIFSEELSSKIRNRLEETTKWEFSPTLCHGNIHPSNALVDQEGVVHIIDWETVTGNRTPYSELAEIYTWNNGRESISHFLRGYGLEENEVKNMMRDIQTLVLLRLVQVIIRKMPQNGDWKQDNYILETSKMLADIDNYQQDVLFTKNL